MCYTCTHACHARKAHQEDSKEDTRVLDKGGADLHEDARAEEVVAADQHDGGHTEVVRIGVAHHDEVSRADGHGATDAVRG